MPACADKPTSDGVEGHPYREFERAGWERAADAYATSFAAITGLFAHPLLEAVGAGPRRQERVLRVGGRLGFTVWASPEQHLLTTLVVDAVLETANATAVLTTPARLESSAWRPGRRSTLRPH